MPIKKVEKIWMNGKLVNWDDARIHLLSHVIHYGSSWFEGIRCYDTKKGSAIFRLDKHLERMYNSVKIYRTEIPYTAEQMENAIKETIRANKLRACYIRPIVYRGYGDAGVNPLNCPVEAAVAVWEWGSYLGPDALQDGIDVCVSTWRRPAPDTLPAMAKAGANYMNSQLIKTEALSRGFIEGIALDWFGNVSEGSGENIFLVYGGAVYTPPLSAALLPGVTRESVITIVKELSLELNITNVPREMLAISDEIFFTGTAAEVTPVRSVDRIPVGTGKPGPVTRKVQDIFFDVVKNGNDSRDWLSFVYCD
ncbi:MAG TPA: branched-chain amino acid transaminase [Bacteroidota bacterium]